MPIHIRTDAATLARSRFGISPATEVVGVVQSRGRHPMPHVRRWYAEAHQSLPAHHLEVLQSLVPDARDHPHVPDFLTPPPRGTTESMSEVVRRIASTPTEVVDYHLDIGLRGRTVHPDVVAQWPGPTAYERWRRAPGDHLQRLLTQGARSVAEQAAAAMQAFFDRVLDREWGAVRTVLEADIAHRGEVAVHQGVAALLAGLGEGFRWTGTEAVLERPYEGIVDWADDGMLLVPSVVHAGPVRFSAEVPDPPVVIYAARGVAGLWGEHQAVAQVGPVVELLGRTRAQVLALLDDPLTTSHLSLLGGWSQATVSHHLGVLRRAGLVTGTRQGRAVFYRRTELGSGLLSGPRGSG
ncbi:ArsR/SmtB family transcription factor [Ornithinimicrobium murale]|uniref:ArsR/SmtB family transcription factor n=1 Tax=Ornithinimicrobium murale TaxID=1050153 RepID=UPI000E0CBFD5|nr:helix-turn-helix domain-containing protein [Ornithinimicrobium murale]